MSLTAMVRRVYAYGKTYVYRQSMLYMLLTGWYLKQFGREIILNYSNLCEKHIRTSQTDRQTDGQTTYCGITALCVASRGKNYTKNTA